MNEPLNQILFGPPGTGKTYNTIFKSLDILDPLPLSWSDPKSGKSRKDAVDAFIKLKDEGRIMFTTFHQSMSYEDFIEGIKPIPPKDQSEQMKIVAEHIDTLNNPKKWKGETRINNLPLMTYEVRDGLFKEFCKKASMISTKVITTAPISATTLKEAYDELYKDIVAGIVPPIITKDGSHRIPKYTPNHIKLPTQTNPGGGYTQSYEKVEELSRVYHDQDSLAKITNTRKAFAPYINKQDDLAFWALLNELYSRLTSKQKIIYTTCPHILIIDEINRGNVANIFGELITLIEEDKRLGNPEGMKVTLPYSREEFGVPNNLYIIGTMNTADRSVEALDSALRRRFTFVEMMPKPVLLNGVQINGIGKSLRDLLTTINERIEVLKDREHQIGHSYFMKYLGKSSVNPNDLKDVFLNKIIPLLQEYFYGDYEKIQLVLGDGFVGKKSDKITFAGKKEYDDDANRFYIENNPAMSDALKTLFNI